jgi:hypothetical protein
MSGVQIIPDRYGSFVEEIGTKTKSYIMSLIRKYEKSGVVFLSGDVHYSQLFSTKCASATGYEVWEVCSSGMTHTLKDSYFNFESTVECHTPTIFKVH